MKDVPIIFSAPMVRALLDGRKTMTRRLAWSIPRLSPDFPGKPSPWQRVKPGDRLWVRENLAVMGNWGVWHDASDPPGHDRFLDHIDARGRAILEKYAPAEATDSVRIPSIYMPRWASRLTLVVTETKIERLQKITHEEAELEGVKCDMSPRGFRDHFAELWKRLHGPESWDANPEVVALTFTVHQQNIDVMPKADAA